VRFEVFTMVKTQVEVFWVVMLCSDVVGYPTTSVFTLKMEAVRSFKM